MARRLTLARTATAAVAAAALALPGLGNGYAYASWTPRPQPVAAADLALVRTACLDEFGSGPPANPGSERLEAKDLTVRLAERRGTWVSVLLTGAQWNTEWEVPCIARLPPGATEVKHTSVAASGGGGFAPPQDHESSWVGSQSSGWTAGCSAAAGANPFPRPRGRWDQMSPG